MEVEVEVEGEGRGGLVTWAARDLDRSWIVVEVKVGCWCRIGEESGEVG